MMNRSAGGDDKRGAVDDGDYDQDSHASCRRRERCGPQARRSGRQVARCSSTADLALYGFGQDPLGSTQRRS